MGVAAPGHLILYQRLPATSRPPRSPALLGIAHPWCPALVSLQARRHRVPPPPRLHGPADQAKGAGTWEPEQAQAQGSGVGTTDPEYGEGR